MIYSAFNKAKNYIVKNTETYTKQFSLVLGLFVMVMALSGCGTEPEKVAIPEEVINSAPMESSFFPLIWIVGEENLYQPAYGYKTRMTTETQDHPVMYFSKSGLQFKTANTESLSFSYLIKTMDGEILEKGSGVTSIDGENRLMEIVPGKEFIEGNQYELEIQLSIGTERGYYYWQMVYSEEVSSDIIIQEAAKILEEELDNAEISIAGDPLMWINVENKTKAVVNIDLTGLKRKSEGFEYKDYHYEILVDKMSQEAGVNGYFFIDKQRFYYDSTKGWLVGAPEAEGNLDESFVDAKEQFTVNAGAFQLIFSQEEMYLYNMETEMMEKIIRQDSFDSDYLYDEYINHEIEVLELTESGEVYFILYGYQREWYHEGLKVVNPISQKNGISFYKYSDGELSLISFLEKSENISGLKHYMSQNSYYNKDEKGIYFFSNRSLYYLDMTTGKYTYVESFIKGDFYSKEGIILWQGSNDKYNGSVFTAHLNNESLVINSIYDVGEHKRLLGVIDNGFIVGSYDVGDTFEYLNQDVNYYYYEINVYNFEGNLTNTIIPDSDMFLSDIYIENSQVYSDLLKREYRGSDKSLKVDYVQYSKPILIGSEYNEDDRSYQNLEKTINQESLILAKEKDQDIIYLADPPVSDSLYSQMSFFKEPADVYKSVDSHGTVKYSLSLVDSLMNSSGMESYKIYYRDKNDGNVEEILLFDSEDIKTDVYMEDVTVIAQRPELPRGCEVTSLSILLNYYMDEAPDKMELFNGMASSTMDYEVKDGIIHFADMHAQFAGSADDASKPGLGVYINPVKNLSNEYIESDGVMKGSFDLTGISFEQMKTFISREIPVLIIIPNRYQPVPNYVRQIWHTPGGFMEVTYQEHSVVVMGFDENYIYYSDPSKEIIDKKPIGDFQKAWESIGSQCMIVLE